MKLSPWKDGEEPEWVGKAMLFAFFGPFPVAIAGAILGLGAEILPLVGIWTAANLLFAGIYLTADALMRREWGELPMPLCILTVFCWGIGKYLEVF
jgi:hypothetical protein